MKKASFILGILYTPCVFAVTLTTTCPSGYKTINRPEFRLATTCDSSEKSIGTISTCLTDSPAAVCWLYAPTNTQFSDATGTYEFTEICPAEGTD